MKNSFSAKISWEYPNEIEGQFFKTRLFEQPANEGVPLIHVYQRLFGVGSLRTHGLEAHATLSRNDADDDAPSPVANATNDRVALAPASPQEGRGERHRTVILPRPAGGEAGPASFRGRVRGSPILQLNRSG